MSQFARKRCVPRKAGTPPMSKEDARNFLREFPGWTLGDDSIAKGFKFKTYLDGLEFAYSLGRKAEEEGHHPDMLIKWKKVGVTLSTHSIKGLSENDFIMADRAEQVYKKLSRKGAARQLPRKRIPIGLGARE